MKWDSVITKAKLVPFALTFLLLLKGFCFAQIGTGGSLGPFQSKYSKLNFRTQLNIFEWIYTFKFQKRLDNKLEFKVDETFNSTLQTIASRDLWKDNQSLTLDFKYPISSRFSIEPIFNSHILSDPLAGFDNNFRYYSGSAQLNFHPTPEILISSRVSSKWQTQLEQSDQGYGYGLNASISDIQMSGYKSDLSILGEQDFFPRRRNEDIRLRYKIERQFYESTADTLLIIFDRLRRDTFGADTRDKFNADSLDTFGADSLEIFIRNLTQSYRGLENRLSYKVASDAILYLKNSIFSTSFRVNNVRNETTDIRKDDSGFESEHSARLNIQKTRWFADARWNYRFRSREDRRPRDTRPDPFGRHPSVGFDTEDELVGLSLRSGWGVDANDSLGVSASVTKFRYDTSDTLNPNDHDQIKWQFTFAHAHRFTEQLQLVWRGSAFLNHFIFVSSEFSSGNNWERFIQLTPEVVFQPRKNFLFRQSVTVRAKYQTYDFDNPETGIRNTVNRQFIVSNISNFDITPRSRVELALNLELAEQGRFFINGWRQRLALSWQNQEVQALFKRQFGANFHLSPGVSFFRQIRWDHKVNSQGKLEKSVRGKHTNFGPILGITYRPNSSLELLFFGNIDFVRSSGRSTEQINNFNVNLNWFF